MFSYLFRNPNAIGLSLERPAFALLVVLVAFFLLRPYPGDRRITWLRCAAFTLLIAALAGLHLTATLPARERAVVAAVDVSDSMGAAGLEWENGVLARFRAALAPGDSFDILTFATDAELQNSDAAGTPLSAAMHHGPTASTHLAEAIDSSLALFPPDRERILLLLTDGNETAGDSRTRIAALRAARVTVHAAAPPPTPHTGVRITRFLAPPISAAGRAVPLRLIADNGGAERGAVLNLYVDGQMSDSAPVHLARGLNTIDMSTRIRGGGGHRLRAEIASVNDDAPVHNSAEVAISLHGPLRLLVVTPRRHSGVAALLQRQGFDVDVRSPADVAGGFDADVYHGILLEDVRSKDLGGNAAAEIERFVRDVGGGLIVAGGGATFGDAGFRGGPLERLLPVSIEARRPKPGTREPLALFLIIDRSNSMGFNSRIGTLRDGEKLRYAKTAALEVIHQLKDQDLLGVIAFDTRPSEIAPLRPLRQNRARLERTIPRLVENGGTDFYEAMLSARDQLARTRVTRRHIILLTDGDTNRAGHGEYASLIRELAAARISVTTIRIGDNTVNLKLLQQISQGTGGSFHHVADVRTLPDLLLREATRAIAPLAQKTELFFPLVGPRHQLLRGLDEADIPALGDYAYTKAKKHAEVLFYFARLERRDPLLAVWNYGLGRVAAFTASPSEDAESWLGWSQVAQFWSQLAQWTARQNAAGDLALSAVRGDGGLELIARAFDTGADDAQLSARLHLDEEHALPLAFSADEPRVFRASLPELPSGRYGITVLRRSPHGRALEIDHSVYIPANEDSAAERRRSSANRPLLEELTKATGGVLDPTTRDLAHRPLGTRKTTQPLDNLLVPLAMLLFLAEIALRRLQNLRRKPDTGSIEEASTDSQQGLSGYDDGDGEAAVGT